MRGKATKPRGTSSQAHERTEKQVKYVRGAAELDLLEAVDDLVEVEDEVGAVGDEEAAGAIKTCV